VGGIGTDLGRFSGLQGITIDTDNNIYSIEDSGYDTYICRVQRFSPNGDFIATWGSYDNMCETDGLFCSPREIVFNEGEIYVADRTWSSDGGFRIQRFDLFGYFEEKYIIPPNPEFDSYNVSMSPDNDGNWHIIGDYNNQKIAKFSPGFVFIDVWGKLGINEGEFHDISQIKTDSAGNVYVYDAQAGRINKFTAEGVYIKRIQVFQPFSLDALLFGRGAMAIDSAGYIYLAGNNIFRTHTIYKFAP